jgi:hypothetical protein
MGKHDMSNDRDWFDRNQERSHRARMPFGEPDEEAAKTPAGHALIVLVREVEPDSPLSCLLSQGRFAPTADDEGVAQEFDVAVRREAVPPDSEAVCTLIEQYRAHRSPAVDA